METSDKDLLLALLEKCIGDKRNYINESDGGNGIVFEHRYNSSSSFVTEKIERFCSYRARQQNNLTLEEDLKCLGTVHFHYFVVKFSNAPSLVLERRGRTEPIKRHIETLSYKTFFGKVRQEQMNVAISKKTLYFTLTHGVITCELTDDEGNAFIDRYFKTREEVKREIDLKKLKERIKNC